MSQLRIKISIDAPTATIILNRAEKCNALTRSMIADLRQAISDLHLERNVRAVILAAAGDAFCSGFDLAQLHETSQQDDAMQQWHSLVTEFRDLLLEMLQFPKPILAAVHGPALAGGLALVLASDLVIGAPEVKVGVPGPRLGIVAGIVAPLLMLRVGGGQAARLMLSAEPIDGSEAHRIGLLHELVAADQTWTRAVEVAQSCAMCAPEALQLTKQMLNETVAERLTTQLTAGAAASATSLTTEAAQEGLAAFVEKRPPQWP